MSEDCQLSARVVDALIRREKLSLVNRLLPGVVHNLSGALQMVRLPLDLLELLMLQGETANAATKLESISVGLTRMGEEIELLAAKTPAPQEPGASLDLAALASQEIAFWRADMYFKHELTVENQLSSSMMLVNCAYLDAALAFNVLIANALEAIQENQPESPKLGLQAINGEGRIGLLVSDFGPGPDPALGERIYEPFITSKSGEHDGLGLFLARKALEPHQGKVFWREGDPPGFVMDFPSA